MRNTLLNLNQGDSPPIYAENVFVPDDCIGLIIAFSQSKILFRGINKKYMKMIENPARYKLEYLQAMRIKPSLLTLRIYFGMDDKTKAQKKYPFLVSKISPKSNNYCWAPVGKKGLRCKRRCKGKLCWQHQDVITEPVFAAPRFQLK